MPLILIPLMASVLSSCSREASPPSGLRLICFVVIVLVPLWMLARSNRPPASGPGARASRGAERARNENVIGRRIIQTPEEPSRSARHTKPKRPPTP